MFYLTMLNLCLVFALGVTKLFESMFKGESEKTRKLVEDMLREERAKRILESAIRECAQDERPLLCVLEKLRAGAVE